VTESTDTISVTQAPVLTPPPDRPPRAITRTVVMVVLMFGLGVALTTVKLPYFVLEPGNTLETEGAIDVQGVEFFESPDGEVRFVTVTQRRVSTVDYVISSLSESDDTATAQLTLTMQDGLRAQQVFELLRGGVAMMQLVATAEPEAVRDWLKARSVRLLAATPNASTAYTAADLTGSVAWVLGAEARGLDAFWSAQADVTVSIPVAGAVDSLNVSAAAAILLFETARQRA